MLNAEWGSAGKSTSEGGLVGMLKFIVLSHTTCYDGDSGHRG